MPILTYRFRGAGVPQGLLPNGWMSWMPSCRTPQRDAVRFTLPGILDPNHLNGIGPLWLLAHLPMQIPGSPGALDMTCGRIEIDAKLSPDFDARGAKWMPWFCRTYNNGPAMTPVQTTNWAMSSVNFFDQLNSTDFATACVDITTDPADWTYAGMDWVYLGEAIASKYDERPLAESIASVNQTFHLPIVGCRTDQPPGGYVDIREIRIACANNPVPPYNATQASSIANPADRFRAFAALARYGDVSGKSIAGRAMANMVIMSDVLTEEFLDTELAAKYLDDVKLIDPASAIQLAYLLAGGNGVPRDLAAARSLFESMPNHPQARYHLGTMQMFGLGGAADVITGRGNIEWAANRSYSGTPQAMAMLVSGRNYFTGKGMAAPNFLWAFIWLERAKKYGGYLGPQALAVANANAATAAAVLPPPYTPSDIKAGQVTNWSPAAS